MSDQDNGSGASADFGGDVSAAGGIGGFDGIGGGNVGGSNGLGSGDGSGGGGTGNGNGGSGTASTDFDALGLGGFTANDPAQVTLGDVAILGQVAAAGLAGSVGKLSGVAISMAIVGTAAYGSPIDAAVGHLGHDLGVSMGWGGQAMLGGLQ